MLLFEGAIIRQEEVEDWGVDSATRRMKKACVSYRKETQALYWSLTLFRKVNHLRMLKNQQEVEPFQLDRFP